MLGEMLDRLNAMWGHPTLTFPMLGEVSFLSKMLGDATQQFHCFQMLDEMLCRLNTSADIVGIANAVSLKKFARYLHFYLGSQSQMHSSFTAYSNYNLHRNV